MRRVQPFLTLVMPFRFLAGFSVFASCFLPLFVLLFLVSSLEAHETAKGPRSVADLAQKLTPSVVNISTRSVVESRESVPLPQVPEGSPFKEFFDDFYEKPNEDGTRKRSIQSLGSGFLIDPSGLVVTNNHVIANADSIDVTFSDGETCLARIVGRDLKTDLALLKVESEIARPVVAFNNKQDLRVGDWVMAIGNPFGLGGSVSVGIVSAQNRDIHTGPYDSFIQTDAAINRGNSGGPLFDMYGRVVGINTAIISPSGDSIGLGFAIPAHIASKVLQQLRDFGETRRGWLGIRVQQINQSLADGLGLSEPRGAMVSWVNEAGPAAGSDLKAGDVIVSFEGRPIASVRDLSLAVANTEVGVKVPVSIIRKGQPLIVHLKVGHMEANERLSVTSHLNSDEENEIFGMVLSPLTRAEQKRHGLAEHTEGAVILRVAPDSLAEKEGLKSGMVIVEMDQKIVTGPQDVIQNFKALDAGKEKSVTLLLAPCGGGDLVFVPFHLKR